MNPVLLTEKKQVLEIMKMVVGDDKVCESESKEPASLLTTELFRVLYFDSDNLIERI